jgi:hypothetical protein
VKAQRRSGRRQTETCPSDKEEYMDMSTNSQIAAEKRRHTRPFLFLVIGALVIFILGLADYVDSQGDLGLLGLWGGLLLAVMAVVGFSLYFVVRRRPRHIQTLLAIVAVALLTAAVGELILRILGVVQDRHVQLLLRLGSDWLKAAVVGVLATRILLRGLAQTKRTNAKPPGAGDTEITPPPNHPPVVRPPE